MRHRKKASSNRNGRNRYEKGKQSDLSRDPLKRRTGDRANTKFNPTVAVVTLGDVCGEGLAED